MTKTLEQIQQENKKFILEAIHGCSYEEALKKEEGDFCHYLYRTNYGEQTIIGDVKSYGYNKDKHFPNAFLIKIIGKPLTLSRVLLALKDKQIGFYDDSLAYIVSAGQDYGYYLEDEVEYICDWNLTKETLEEQTEETQREVNKLLTGE